MVVRVFVEGGGEYRLRQAPLRRALHRWIERAAQGTAFKVIACGGRSEAFEDFRTGIADDRGPCVLLVDSEEAVEGFRPPRQWTPEELACAVEERCGTWRWEHVERRGGDGWEKPDGATGKHLHFMAQAMEAWLCADPEALAAWFGHGFKIGKLPRRRNIEDEPKADLNAKLQAATRESKRGSYKKGRDFALIGQVDPEKVQEHCAHARIFVEALRRLG
jgi:hypothetical protein